MAMNAKTMIVFGFGMLLVTFWCMKVTEAHDAAHAGCNSKHSDAGEECTDEDDSLGLYSDVDDTFRTAKKHIKAHIHEGMVGDHDDSPDVAHNNVNVLGHWFVWIMMMMVFEERFFSASDELGLI